MYMIILETVRHVTVTYDLGNLADWVSALATVAAVIVSLYLANYRDRPKILITFSDKNDCRVTNKGFRPVELKIKLPGYSFYDTLPLQPMHSKIENIKDPQPFNKDYTFFSFEPGNHKVMSAKGIDIISNSKYHFIFYKDKDGWKIKEYKFWLVWKILLIWRRAYARIQKN